MKLDSDDSQVVAKAYSTHVMYDYANRVSLPVPEEFKARVERFQGAL